MLFCFLHVTFMVFIYQGPGDAAEVPDRQETRSKLKNQHVAKVAQNVRAYKP